MKKKIGNLVFVNGKLSAENGELKTERGKLTTDYNNFSKTFSNSRKNMKWEEIDYFFSFLDGKKDFDVLDVGCGNARLFSILKEKNLNFKTYLGIDLSKELLKEAKFLNKEAEVLNLDMMNLEKIDRKFDFIFFIASFHHLNSLEKRLEALEKSKKLLKKDSIIFMTNWSLESSLNKEKYKKSKIKASENKFGSSDFSIKIGKYNRFYHCFSLEELDYLFNKTGFEILENREFENKKNIVSIAKI